MTKYHEPLGVLRPGIVAARRLGMKLKFALLALILLVPLVIVALLLLQRQGDALSVARSEIEGMSVVPPVVEVIHLVQQHRGRADMQPSPGPATAPDLEQTRTALAAALTRATAAIRATRSFDLAATWQPLAQRVQRLVAAPATPGNAESFQLHGEMVRDLRHFVLAVGESSGLLYDPEPDAYLLMDMVVTRNLVWMEQLALATGAGADALARAAAEPLDAALLRLRAVMLSEVLKEQGFALAMLQRNQVPELGGAAAMAASGRFAEVAQQLLSGSGAKRDPAEYVAQGASAIGTLQAMQARMGERLAESLAQRVAALQRERTALLLGTVAGLLLLVYAIASFYRAVSIDLGRLNYAMKQLAVGNLQVVATVRSKDELDQLAVGLRAMIRSVSTMVAAVGSDAALVAHAGEQLSLGNRDLAHRTEQQADNLQQTAASVQELAATVRQNAQVAGDVDRQAIKLRDIAEAGAGQMGAAIASVEAIQAGARRMNEVIGVIDTLAFQTNILALNAAVEAARAGDQGRGFAVVAGEVRSLAQRSAARAGEIRTLIKESSAQVEASVSQIRAAGDGMSGIVSGARAVSASISRISAASVAQSSGLAEVASSIGQLDEITQRNAQMVGNAVDMSGGLETQARSLTDAIGNFRLLQGVSVEAQALVDRAARLRDGCGSRDAFLDALTDPANGFHDRDMYVFALDARGTYLAFAGNPAKVGTRVQDVPGIDGDGLVRAIVTQASSGPGWVSYDITNPASGRVQGKMSFVCELDGLYLGCGVYRSLAG